MPEPLSIFPLFSRLPFELRLLVWEEAITALPGRVILLSFENNIPTLAHLRGYGHTLQSKPHLYHACLESKKVYDAYQIKKRSGNSVLSVGTPLAGDGRAESLSHFPPESSTVTMDFTKDVLVFLRQDNDTLGALIRLIGSETLDKIRHVGSLVGDDLDAQCDTYFDLMNFQRSFKSLETSTAVIEYKQGTALKSTMVTNAHTLVAVTGLPPEKMNPLREFYWLMDMHRTEQHLVHQHLPSSTGFTGLVKIELMQMKEF